MFYILIHVLHVHLSIIMYNANFLEFHSLKDEVIMISEEIIFIFIIIFILIIVLPHGILSLNGELLN